MSWRDMPRWAKWTAISGVMGGTVMLADAIGALGDLYELQPVATKTWVKNRIVEHQATRDEQLAKESGDVQQLINVLSSSVLDQDERALRWRLEDYGFKLIVIKGNLMALEDALAAELAATPVSEFIVRNLRSQIDAAKSEIAEIERTRDREECDLNNLRRPIPRPC